MDYSTAVDYISSFINFEKIPQYSYASSFNLERMQAFLKRLKNPHRVLKVIHIAGSKGKGSTCALIAAVLKEAGYRVGLYTSPHLVDIRERIRILKKVLSVKCKVLSEFEGVIAEDEFVGFVERIKPAAEEFKEHKDLGKLSFFEFLTAMAFLYFKEERADFAVLETGLGGRLDATNVSEPIVCGITNISFEHADKLGNSLRAIAREKAGIIKVKSGKCKVKSLVVSAPQGDEVRDVIREVCSEKNARLYEVSRDIKYSIISSGEQGSTFNLKGPNYSYKNLKLSLLGEHQVENAALSIAMLKLLEKDKVKIDEGSIRSGLKSVSWPGRMQLVQKEPYLILDGAHNAASFKALLSSIKKIFSYGRLIVVFGISSDKDIKGVTEQIDEVSDLVILTKADFERAKDPLSLKGYFSKAGIKLANNAGEALDRALEIAGKKDLILVTGSLYVVGEVYGYYKTR